jgi:hypothetical protein
MTVDKRSLKRILVEEINGLLLFQTHGLVYQESCLTKGLYDLNQVKFFYDLLLPIHGSLLLPLNRGGLLPLFLLLAEKCFATTKIRSCQKTGFHEDFVRLQFTE